jgi:secondary thiamine-phosphate synthase enzyme
MNSFPIIREQVRTHHRCQMIDLTQRVQAAVTRLQVRHGLVLVQSPHTTAGLTINENADPDVQHDLLAKLEQLTPQRESFYRHGEGNSDAHLKTSMVGISLTLMVDEGELQLGTWQGVYLCEFDGPRTRDLWIKVIAADTWPAREREEA